MRNKPSIASKRFLLTREQEIHLSDIKRWGRNCESNSWSLEETTENASAGAMLWKRPLSWPNVTFSIKSLLQFLQKCFEIVSGDLFSFFQPQNTWGFSPFHANFHSLRPIARSVASTHGSNNESTFRRETKRRKNSVQLRLKRYSHCWEMFIQVSFWSTVNKRGSNDTLTYPNVNERCCGHFCRHLCNFSYTRFFNRQSFNTWL